nr:ribonuclease H-like domain-containing protein [Tanacetum cinerariifolium]
MVLALKLHNQYKSNNSTKEVIENGATLPKTQVVKGVTTEVRITTAEEKAQRRLEDAKKLLEAVEKRFGRNITAKKTQRNLLKQQYENFTALSLEMFDQTFDRLQKLVSQLELLEEKLSQEDVNQNLLSLSPEWNTHVVVWSNKAYLDTMNVDDLYNNLKVYEPKVKGMSSSISSTQNMAFVSSLNNNTSSANRAVNTTQAVNTAHGVFTANTQAKGHGLLQEIKTTSTRKAQKECVMETSTSIALVSCDVPPPYTRNFMPPAPDLSFTGLDKFVNKPKVGNCKAKYSEKEPEGNPQIDLQDQRVIDSGCSRHIKGNMSYLTNYKEIDEGYVDFGRNPKGGKITRKGTIKTDNLDFENVYFVKELKFNLFSVSQMYDKKNIVLLNDTEYDYSKFTWVFFLATKDETSGILKSFITRLENLVDYNVKVIRCNNGTEFKNIEMNQFCELKGIFRQFSIARTPQQNAVVKKRNRILIDADMTMLADSNEAFRVFNSRTKIVEENLHIRFSESTANVVGSGPDWLFDIDALTRTMNYEPIVAATIPSSSLSFEKLNMITSSKAGMFGSNESSLSSFVPATLTIKLIVLTLRNRTLIEAARTMLANSKLPTTLWAEAYHLGKFYGKADEGFFIGYFLNSKAFKVFNSRTKIVEENLHIRFSESTPNVLGSGPDWLFDIDALTRTMNYEPIVADPKSSHNDGSKPLSDDGKKVDEDLRKENKCNDQVKDDNVNNINNVNAVSSTVNAADTNRVNVVGENISIEL